MTLTKADLIDSINNKHGLARQESSQVIESILEIIKKTLESGEDVLVSGFGKFQVREKRERRGLNPASGDDMILETREVVTFKCAGKLRDRINTG